jgi:secondary thiamine-phosphate synthase enzyme
MIEFTVHTTGHCEFLPITRLVQEALTRQGWKNGTVTVFIPHTTAGVTIQENADPDVIHDLAHALDRMAPWDDPKYRHGEGNSAAHVKASLVGSSVHCPVEKGKLQLGTWQGIFFSEFDGPRTRQVWLTFAPGQ